MSYIKKGHRQILNLCDNRLNITKEFVRFRQEHELKHNLIIKGKQGNSRCTNCNHNFICNTKVNKEARCPYCKQKLLVKTTRLQNFIFKDNLQYIDRIPNSSDYVIRTFELYSSYDGIKIKHYCTEFMRTLFIGKEHYDYVSDLVSNNMGYMYISHWREHKMWRKRSRWSYITILGLVCPYNLKRLFKGTLYQYSQLDAFVKHMNYLYIIDYLKSVPEYPRFEYLVKLKLYNLAIDVSRFNSITNKFQDVFKVSKDLLPFMQKYDITYEELEVLQCCQVPNIRLLRGLAGCNHLRWISSMVDIEKAWKCGLLSQRTENIYFDYLESCYKLQYDFKDKRIVYPAKEQLYELHDKVTKLVEVAENELNDNLIKKRAKELEKYKYQNKGLIIQCFQDLKSIIDEASQMSNCVFTNYSEKYAMGKCNLFAVRDINDINKSLITVETDINNTKIIQAELSHHRSITDEQQKFLDKWLKHIKQKVVINNV